MASGKKASNGLTRLARLRRALGYDDERGEPRGLTKQLNKSASKLIEV
jgi:hypothetical protein